MNIRERSNWNKVEFHKMRADRTGHTDDIDAYRESYREYERLEREERRRHVASNVCLYQLMAICGATGLAAVVVAVWALTAP